MNNQALKSWHWDYTGLADFMGDFIEKVSEKEMGWCPDFSEMWGLLLEDESGAARSLSHVGQWHFTLTPADLRLGKDLGCRQSRGLVIQCYF